MQRPIALALCLSVQYFCLSGCGSSSDDDATPSSGGKGGGSNTSGGSKSVGGSNTSGGSKSMGGSNTSGGSKSTGGSSASGGDAGTAAQPSGDARYFGDTHSGNFWLGPVDYAETQWHNACAPSNKYPAGIRSLYGSYLLGLANEVVLGGLDASSGQLCDTCAELTANGVTLVAHAVTYGEETGPNDIDVSPEANDALGGDEGRAVSWRFVTCPTNDPVHYTFDGRQWSNTFFFRLWVRNARVPIDKVEYRVGSGAWSEAEWQSDGAFQASDDFSGGFSVRVTSLDGQTLEDDVPGLDTFDPDAGVSSHGNFN
jgi:hypothetical protein